MPVRQAKSQLELGLTRPRVFRQWKLGSEPPQFGDLSVTEAQIYLATGSDIEALFLYEEHGNHPGFWANTDPVYDPHRLIAHADALNRPYIGMQIAIPAQWVEVTVRYSKQTAQTLAKLGRTSRKGYRLAKEQIRSRRQHEDSVVPNPVTSCGCGFSDNHRIDGDWIDLPRVLTSEGVLHVLRVWPVSACGQVVSNPDAARTFEPRRHLETEKPWRYCPRCWPIAKRRLLDLSRERMGAPKSVASQAAENGASSPPSTHQASVTYPNIPVAHYPRQVISFSTPKGVSLQRADVHDTAGEADDSEDDNQVPVGQWAMQYRRVVAHDGLLHIGPASGGPFIPLVCDSEASWYMAYTPGDLVGLQTAFSHMPCPACEAWLAEQPPIEVEQVILGRPSVLSVSLRSNSEPESTQSDKKEAPDQMPTFLLTEPKAYLPTILQEAGLISSRDRARAAINDGSVAIESWPPIAHRYTFKSEDLNGKTLTIDGIPALWFTTQVTVDSPERTDS